MTVPRLHHAAAWLRGSTAYLPPLVFCLFSVYCLGLLLAFGVVETPDSRDYITYAELLRRDGLRAGADHLDSHAISPALARPPGYPLFLALLITLSPLHWRELAAIIQILLTASALAIMSARVAAVSGESRGLLPAFAMTVLTGVAQWPVTIMTEGLYVGLIVTAVAITLRRGRLTPRGTMLAGIAIALAFLLREGTIALVLAVLPAVVLAARGFGRAGYVVLFAAPLMATAYALVLWNEARFGVGLLTTSSQWTLPEALLIVSRSHFDLIYTAGHPFTQAARLHLRRHELDEVVTMNAALFEQQGMNAVVQAREARRLFLDAWRRAPITMALASLSRVNANFFAMTCDPLGTVGHLAAYAGVELPLLTSLTRAVRAARGGSPEGAVLLLIHAICRIIAFATWIVAMSAVRLLWARGVRAETRRAVLSLLGFTVIWLALCLPFRINDRYLAPMLPAVLALATIAATHWRPPSARGEDEPIRSTASQVR